MKPFAACVPVLFLVAACSGSDERSSDAWDDAPPPSEPLTESQVFPEYAPQGDEMSIQDGSTVTMHFTMTNDGEVLQTTREAEPLTYVQGQEQMFPAIESALVGLTVGDKKEVTLEPADAFGDRNSKAIQTVPKAGFQDPGSLAVGNEVRGQSPQGEFRAVVTAVDEETVTLDLNHPLAGKTLIFDLEIIAIQ